MDAKPLPEHKIQGPLFAIGFLFLLTIGVSLLPASWLGAKQEVRRLPPIDLSKIGATSQNDTNLDGVLSWREFVSDSLDLSSKSSEPAQIEIDPQSLAVLNDPNNLTSSFSKNLYIASVALKESGVRDALSEQEVITQLVQQEKSKVASTSYTAADIRVAKSETSQTKKAYGNKVASAIKNLMTEETIRTELSSFVKFLETTNEGDLLPLKKRVEVLDIMLENLHTLEVPASAASLHVQALNRIGTLRNTLDDMTRAYHDPMRAIFAVEHYQDDLVSAGRLRLDFTNYFKGQGIVFTSSESGYLFMGYTK